MEYRLNKEGLLANISMWNSFLKKKVHLIACGGTALTLIGAKDSTKDVDFIIPIEKEYDYLINNLKNLGYRNISGVGWSRGEEYTFDLFKGNKVHTTELLESPLEKGKNIPLKEFTYIYVGILNYYDIIVSKLFRGTGVDFEDCLSLVKFKSEDIDLGVLKKHFLETSSYEIAQERVNRNLDSFLRLVMKEGIYGR
ncbi:MAG: hypothetical protein KAS05_02385 [Candidatus Omnitrophica bacterium]|nr:hypothetical protein [Candidatus Omnitrophota bacterium]